MFLTSHKNAADLRPGEKGVVDMLTDDAIALKLMEMGFLPGAEVEMVHCGLLGDPVCIRIQGFDLALRKSEASSVALA